MKNSQLESNPSCSPDKDALNFSDRLLVAAKVCAKTWKPSDFEKFKELFLEAKQKNIQLLVFFFLSSTLQALIFFMRNHAIFFHLKSLDPIFQSQKQMPLIIS